jgi:hypothetical protein
LFFFRFVRNALWTFFRIVASFTVPHDYLSDLAMYFASLHLELLLPPGAAARL